MGSVFPEIKRRLHEDGYTYSNYEDILEYCERNKKYQIEVKERLRKIRENDPEGEKWYNVKYGTEILVSHDNIKWEKEKFSSRNISRGKYVVEVYFEESCCRFYSSHAGGVPNTWEYEYAKLITD